MNVVSHGSSIPHKSAPDIYCPGLIYVLSGITSGVIGGGVPLSVSDASLLKSVDIR